MLCAVVGTDALNPLVFDPWFGQHCTLEQAKAQLGPEVAFVGCDLVKETHAYGAGGLSATPAT
ncbi:MAG: hypothetical protein IT195_13585 [Microthrixaceae bacterium]|nr:hypothetical protein [Microthrixaceae bacterium]